MTSAAAETRPAGDARPPSDAVAIRAESVASQNPAAYLQPTPRPHSNSICSALLKPGPRALQCSRAHMHRASDGLLLSEQYKLTGARRDSNFRPSFQEDYYYHKVSTGRQETSIFSTIWASYLFVFIAVLITFSIVFAVGYLLNSMTYKEKAGAANMTLPLDSPDFGTATVERVRDVFRLKNKHVNRTDVARVSNSHEAQVFHLGSGGK